MTAQTFIAPVRGATFRIKEQPEVKEIIESLRAEEEVTLQREPDNRFDENAIKVLADGGRWFIGYVGKEFAADIAPDMDNGAEIDATIDHFAGPLSPVLSIVVESEMDEPGIDDEIPF